MALWKRHSPRPDFIREERRWHRRALFLRRKRRRRRAAIALIAAVAAAIAAAVWLYHAPPDFQPEQDAGEPGRTVIPVPLDGEGG
jgi:ferric-dicitrate binding protein FerR (iron transport regulator)